MPQYRILSMDGGYGWNTATLLQMVAARLPAEHAQNDLLDHVDLFTGVSAGGINSLFFATKEHPTEAIADIAEFWQKVNQSAVRGLLPHNFLRGVIPDQLLRGDPRAIQKVAENAREAAPAVAAAASNPFSPQNLQKLPELIWNVWGAAVRLGFAATGVSSVFSSFDLRQFFIEYFGATTRLGDLKKKVAITSFQLDNGEAPPLRSWKPKVFHNFEREGQSEPDLDELVVDVALRTAAAPVEEPIYQGLAGTGPGFVDGGVVANNPAMIGVAQALSAGVPLQDILLFSLSTGRNLVGDVQYLAPVLTNGVAPWGYFQWLLDPRHPLALLEMVLEGSSDAVDYQCDRILGPERFHRLNPPISRFQVPNDALTTALVGESVDFLVSSGWLDDNHVPGDALLVAPRPVPAVRRYAALLSQEEASPIAPAAAVPPPVETAPGVPGADAYDGAPPPAI